MPDMAGMTPDTASNNTDIWCYTPNQASQTWDFSDPLVCSLLFAFSSPIIAEHKVKSSLSISPFHEQKLTPSMAYAEYTIH